MSMAGAAGVPWRRPWYAVPVYRALSRAVKTMPASDAEADAEAEAYLARWALAGAD
jgi:hypothetical protein